MGQVHDFGVHTCAGFAHNVSLFKGSIAKTKTESECMAPRPIDVQTTLITSLF